MTGVKVSGVAESYSYETVIYDPANSSNVTAATWPG